MEVITEKNNLLKIIFPSVCLRCLDGVAKKGVEIIETNFLIRSLHNPFSILSILVFLLTGGIAAGIGHYLEMDLFWTWLFMYVLIVSAFKNLTEKSSQSVEMPYCSACLKKWQQAINIEYGLKLIFVVGSSAALFFGVHKAYPAVIPSVWAVSFVLFFFVRKFLNQSDPPLDLRRANQNTVAIKFGNNDFAKQTIEINEVLKNGFECNDCRAYVSLKANECPKCEAGVEDLPND
ncbi:hypothetical protein JYT87_02580 [Nitrospira defluvii]|nr:hypothetical protein [Nitrospira defluvii]